MAISGAAALMDALVTQGVTTVFGYPGGAIMPTYNALYDYQTKLRHVLVRHEQGAIHAAQGYARASGQVGVCLATSGPGATNLITGLVDTLMDSTPVVCITGQVRSNLLGTDAFQEADVIGLTLAATKWSCQVTTADAIGPAVADAFRIACSGRPGPVLIDFTRDAQAALVNKPYTRTVTDTPIPVTLDSAALKAAAQLLNTAQRPLMMVGHGALIAGAEQLVVDVAERAGVPVASTLLGLSTMPCEHPLYVGMLGMHGNAGPNRLTNQADVILAVGMRFDDRVTGNLDTYAKQAKIIHIEIDPRELNRRVSTAVAIEADARAAMAGLLPLLEARRHPSWLAQFHEQTTEEYRVAIAPELEPAEGALRMGEVVNALSAHTKGQALIVSDVGQHQMQTARYYRFAQAHSHITSGGAGTMGFALPAAIGAKLARPDRTVIAIIGDGGFQMTLQELGTLAQEGFDLKIVILNNRHLGMVRQWQELFFDRRYSQVEIASPDYVTLCRAYGIPARRIDERTQLSDAITELLTANGPRLLEVMVEAQANVFPMVPAGASVAEIRLS